MTSHICNRELSDWLNKTTVAGTHLSHQKSHLKIFVSHDYICEVLTSNDPELGTTKANINTSLKRNMKINKLQSSILHDLTIRGT